MDLKRSCMHGWVQTLLGNQATPINLSLTRTPPPNAIVEGKRSVNKKVAPPTRSAAENELQQDVWF